MHQRVWEETRGSGRNPNFALSAAAVFASFANVRHLISKWTDEFRRAWLNISEPSLPLNVAFVIFCLGACTLFRWFITLIRPDTPFSIYFPAVLFATAFGGLRGGIAATIGGGILGFAVAFLNEPPVASLLVLFLIYLTISGLIIWGIQHYRSLIAHQRQISSRLMEEEQYRKLVVNELQHRTQEQGDHRARGAQTTAAPAAGRL